MYMHLYAYKYINIYTRTHTHAHIILGSCPIFMHSWVEKGDTLGQVIVTREIMEKLMEMPEWEGQLEEQPGASAIASDSEENTNAKPRNYQEIPIVSHIVDHCVGRYFCVSIFFCFTTL